MSSGKSRQQTSRHFGPWLLLGKMSDCQVAVGDGTSRHGGACFPHGSTTEFKALGAVWESEDGSQTRWFGLVQVGGRWTVWTGGFFEPFWILRSLCHKCLDFVYSFQKIKSNSR